MFKISKPTKAQVIHAGEVVAVLFVGTAVSVWRVQPDPFSKAAAVAAFAAGLGAVYGLVKGFTTTL